MPDSGEWLDVMIEESIREEARLRGECAGLYTIEGAAQGCEHCQALLAKAGLEVERGE